MKSLILLPPPRSITYHDGRLTLENGKLIAIPSPSTHFVGRRLQKTLARIGIGWEVVVRSDALPASEVGVNLELSALTTKANTGYELHIAASGITIASPSPEGLWNGTLTLIQIIEQAGRALPQMMVADSPDFERRGVMLDISRDKVPTMDTLFALIDRLASWKINEFQLYTEHTFAYRQHKPVWEKASPMTGEQILDLQAFCKERFMDLVPNQNSFGHMDRWLVHDAYRHLAEVPEGLNWPGFLTPRPFTLAPSDPGSIALIQGLYDELLPHFDSPHFNVGCDETFDLGLGKSKALVEAKGKERVYLDYLRQIAGLVQQHGKDMMFWGDIIIQHPELVPELRNFPVSVTALEWGYEADHPFDRHGAKFAEAGVRFYVCPGTSSWMSLIGRTDNAIGNLGNAALNGLRHGAAGFLNTDWGDFGHPQPLPVSYLGFAYGAAAGWCVETAAGIDLPAALDQFAYEDPTRRLGRLAFDLGNLYKIIDDYPQFNGATAVRALYTPVGAMRAEASADGIPATVTLSPEKIAAAIAALDTLQADLKKSQPADPLIIAEYDLACDLWRHGAKRLLMEYAPTRAPSRELMGAEIAEIIARYREVWLKRNRPGGLDDSLVRLERLRAEYAGVS
ncbi:MAG TPA: family 20 glycosylhydrolase [Aggregatilineales bacterium]|nr:family 20 glycosylhydrolase [Aggregatilineales bacterium]